MINKKFLIHKLLELPEITDEDYLNLIKIKNKHNNNQFELSQINEKIKLYNEKNMIVNLIKTPYYN
jgi:replicative DNA helicase